MNMVGRFTLDSATEFLFWKSAHSLSAELVYPKNWVQGRNEEYANHRFLPTGRFGSFWRLAEFWRDRIRKEMEVCHRFIDPTLKDALETNGQNPAARLRTGVLSKVGSSRRPTYDDVQGMKHM
ncbi:hypothetical protein EDD16DRAFT_1569468 [Pisolithus croceorrhizus]|nr:hypothetical protein EDD16DRAFT_1569468 [Pisolithus croceorrhizus]